MDKIQFLTKEEHRNLEIGKLVFPTYLQIELPNNVPSNVKPIVIFPNGEYESITVKVVQNGKDFALFDATLSPNESHVINLNTGVE